MPQLWKIKRELKRLGRTAVALPVDMGSYFFGSVYYDIFLSQHRRIRTGTKAAADNQAIYLIFPVNGLLPSHIHTLEYLCSKGVSVTVVSNFPLGQEDETKIISMCRRYIERPNFGYDFGGYRDGIVSIEQELPKIKQLILLNDSVWFPITEKTDWLEDVAALDVDFSAAVSNYGTPRVDAKDFRSIGFDYRTDHKNFHYCSFALSIGEKILKHPGFLKFWKRFPLTSKKRKAVRRGEIGLSSWVLKNGFRHGETMGVATLKERLEMASDHQLADIAAHIIIPEDPYLKAVQTQLGKDMYNVPRQDLINFILTAIARQGAGYCLAYFAILELGFPFLKKSPLWLDRKASDVSVEILQKLDTPISREFLLEAKALRERLAIHT